MDAKQQTKHLVRLQAVALEIREARGVVAAAPGRIEAIEARFRERNAEYVAVKERNDTLERENRERNLELGTLAESRKKFMDDLMQVQNQREYAAILKEIDTVKARISDHEDTVLANMGELETLKTDLDARASHIEEERRQVATERAAVEAEVRDAEQRIERGTAERERIESQLPAALLSTVRRVEDSRQGVFLAPVHDATCQACYVRVRPQAFQEIKLGSRLHACTSCRRFLYWPAVVESAAPEDAGAASETPSEGELPSAGAAHGA